MTDLVRPFTNRLRLAAVLMTPVVAVLLAGCSAAAAPAAPSTSGAGGSTFVGAPPIAAPADASSTAPAPVGAVAIAPNGGTSSTNAASAGTANAYPYPIYGGNPGLAPDHELVVSGTGMATVKADLSNQAAAERSALERAMADAKAQADAAVNAAGVALGAVVSISVSVGGGYGIVPMAEGGASSSGSGSLAPQAPATPVDEQLEVTVTVAYSIT